MNKIPAYKRRLSSKDIMETRTLFPLEMREPFTWLCEFLCDECDSNVDLLEPMIRDVGLDTTASTIIKLIMGRWDVDASGNKCAPIIKARTFVDLVNRLRNQARLKKVHGQVEFIPTSTWDLVRNYIDVRRSENSICKIGLILGATGTQKGACGKRYCAENNHGTCTYIEAPDSPSMSKFTRTIARPFRITPSWSVARQFAELDSYISKSRTIYIANIQRLYRPNSGWYQPVFNWIQTIQERSGCTFILEAAITSELATSIRHGGDLDFFEQFVGRCGGPDEILTLPDYPNADDLAAIAAAFKLEPDKKTVALLDTVVRKKGRIRTLFWTLQKASRIASGAKQPLTIEHIREVLDIKPLVDDTATSELRLEDTRTASASPAPSSRASTANLLPA